ncbi:hypothetical protein BKA67DRAFT_673766 [Truncatella angustata]|uniref:Tyrosinase copper-binding domain-containing protein n=1 Tax=Truncatella angustata TaxID=152316 RepID=A0A9P8UTA9_9PEZI|nr:uncharacterized protein BKA67DRAFT_673766 [Truncatella angustata]KAH6657959.1 hypothetical protein BKA67DRAFT_673766 [Truncatella angustata]
MYLPICSVALLFATPSLAYVPESTFKTDLLATGSLLKLAVAAANGSLKNYLATEGVDQICGVSHSSMRRECSFFNESQTSLLSEDERLKYTSAIKCLMALPSKLPVGFAPGAKSCYGDFVNTHVNQTRNIHFDDWFFPWHRAYIWSFETALLDECGYEIRATSRTGTGASLHRTLSTPLTWMAATIHEEVMVFGLFIIAPSLGEPKQRTASRLPKGKVAAVEKLELMLELWPISPLPRQR